MNMLRLGITPEGQIGSHPDIIATLRPQKCARCWVAFAYCAFRHDATQSALVVLACITAALFLPPLVALAVFFCGLHSPRHMANALRETGGLSKLKKAAIVTAVSALSFGLGVLMFLYQGDVPSDMGVVRSAFILISTLTVPHFILEHLMTYKNNRCAIGAER
jgi:beta-carotene 15,15'-dioxygenase